MTNALTIYGKWRGIPVAMYTPPLPGNWPMATRVDEELGTVAYQYALSTFDVWPELREWIDERHDRMRARALRRKAGAKGHAA